VNASRNNASPKRHRRRLQFSLRALFAATVVLAACFAYVGRFVYRVRHQRAVVAKIEALGGSVAYDDEGLRGYAAVEASVAAKLLRPYFGHDAFSNVRFVFVGYQFPDEMRPANRRPTRAANSVAGTNADLAILSELPELLDVVMHKPPTDDEGMRYLARIHKLRGLDLKHPIATDDGLAELRVLPQLQRLSLEGPSVNDETIRRIRELSHLQFVRFSDTSITSAGLKQLVGLDELREIDFFGGTNIVDNGLQSLTQLPNLETLSLLGTNISDEGLGHLRAASRLKALTLYGTEVGDNGLQHIVQIPSLRVLNLAYTHVTDSGLAMLETLPELEELYLFNTDISDAGAVHIAKLKQLRILRTEDTKVTEAGLFLLRDHKHLETLSVGPDVLKGALKELQDTLPDCEIEYRWTIGRPQPNQR
jgi:hypothetical protein